jgi:protein gp37
MAKTSIEWTQEVWNPTRGCSRVSPGCERCYAEVMAARFSDEGYWGHGFAERGKHGGRWTRRLALVTEEAFPGHGKIDTPLHWRTPRTVFVNSTSDLFHEDLTNEEIAAVFGVMAACPQHVFQILTKRAKRLREWHAWLARECIGCNGGRGMTAAARCLVEAQRVCDHPLLRETGPIVDRFWPLSNVWQGVSVESQPYADERVPDLLACDAMVFWVSYEPALGPVDFSRFLRASLVLPTGVRVQHPDPRAQLGGTWDTRRIGWIVCGGESGPRARPFNLAWARAVRDQCAAMSVPYFFKQAGANVYDEGKGLLDDEDPLAIDVVRVMLKAKKGGDLSEIPADLRIRQFPKVA